MTCLASTLVANLTERGVGYVHCHKMRFWGIFVKPKEPYTLRLDGTRGIRITRATLGMRNEWNKVRSTIECAVGNNPPVAICTLMNEIPTCHMDLVLDEESQDIVFTVFGNRGIHLSGYYRDPNAHVCTTTHHHHHLHLNFNGKEDKRDTKNEENKTLNEEADLRIQPDTEDLLDLGDQNLAVDEKEKTTGIFRRPAKRKRIENHITPDIGEEAHQVVVVANDKLESTRTHGTGLHDDSDAMMIKGDLERDSDIDCNSIAVGCPSKEKKSKTQENDCNLNTGVPVSSMEEKGKSIMNLEIRNVDAVTSSKMWTLSNGMTIEELALGEPNGKVAASGSKVKAYFTVSLKESGDVIATNIGATPFKFRLGDEKFIKGLHVGIEGMRVGGKRRVILPPSMGIGKRAKDVIPANSWLELEVELVGVR